MTFGDIVVGSSASQELTIHNNSDCSLHYNLLIDQEILGPYDDEQIARDVLGKFVISGFFRFFCFKFYVILPGKKYTWFDGSVFNCSLVYCSNGNKQSKWDYSSKNFPENNSNCLSFTPCFLQVQTLL